jgi:hypothetical protein
MLHCNIKRKQQGCAKLPRTFAIPPSRRSRPRALTPRKPEIYLSASARSAAPAPAADRREFYLFFINHCQG